MQYKLEEQKSAIKNVKTLYKKLPNCLMIILNINLGLNIDHGEGEGNHGQGPKILTPKQLF